jgi:hypothetical protein
MFAQALARAARFLKLEFFGKTDDVWHRAISAFFYRAQWLMHRIEMTVEEEAIKRKHFIYNEGGPSKLTVFPGDCWSVVLWSVS